MTYTDATKSAPTVLVEFYATWCPHCRRMMPVVEQLKELVGKSVPVIRLDIDENEESADEAKVNSVPTFIVYRDGREVWRHSGEIDGQALLSHLQN